MARRVLRWILTGGIGSGKSTVAGVLRDLGITVVDADHIAHDVYEPGAEAFDQIAERWPEIVVGGRIDRRRLAKIVFGDRSELRALEELVHPPVRQRLRRIVREAGNVDLVVEVSVPQRLVDGAFDVVVVDAPDEARRVRLANRGLTDHEIRERMEFQPTRQEWLETGDLVIDNSGDLHSLEDEVSSAIARGRARAVETG